MAKQGSDEHSDGVTEKLVGINRVTKVVKGGRIMSFAALVVVGNGDGQIGIGKGKAKEVPLAIQKATDHARKHMVKIPLNNRTIYHEVHGKHGATRVYMQPAKEGNGVKAGGPMRILLDVLGVSDISAKIHGSSNPYNITRATLNALMKIKTPDEIARKRGLSVEEILG